MGFGGWADLRKSCGKGSFSLRSRPGSHLFCVIITPRLLFLRLGKSES